MRSQLIQSSSVLDQRLDQIDQQGEEATGSCGLWIEREEGEAQLTRVQHGGQSQTGRPAGSTAASRDADPGLVALHLANAIHLAVNGNGAPLIAGGRGREG